MTVTLDGESLTIDKLVDVARNKHQVEVTKGGWQRISGKGSGEVTVSWCTGGGSGCQHTMGNCNQYTAPNGEGGVGP